MGTEEDELLNELDFERDSGEPVYSKLVRVLPIERLQEENIKVYYESIEHTTMKAILFSFYDDELEDYRNVWVPKALCKNLNERDKTVYIYEPFFANNKEWILLANECTD